MMQYANLLWLRIFWDIIYIIRHYIKRGGWVSVALEICFQSFSELLESSSGKYWRVGQVLVAGVSGAGQHWKPCELAAHMTVG